MQCIRSRYSIENSIKKSRFIGVLIPRASEIEINQSLRQLHLDYPDASHITFAYRLKTGNGFISRFNDAGEPTGTAGKPIFQHLEGKELINVMLAVVRYFGGIKLGAGGLTRAYSNTARHVIEIAELHPYVEYVQKRLTIDYKQMATLEHLLKKLEGDIIEQDFAGQIHLTIQLPNENIKQFLASFSRL
jgi:uncharacterized YigZ family protein